MTGILSAAERKQEQKRYIDAAKRELAIDNPRVLKWATNVCPECGEEIISDDDTDEFHILFWGNVLIGCEGYWVIDPNELGIDSPNWNPWK